MTKVVHCKKELYDIYIGRPKLGQPWNFGNPFEIGEDGDREQCIYYYFIWLTTGENRGNINATKERREWILKNLFTLKNKILGCWCKPNACHGDILIKLLNKD